jgi:hypothetical protein
MSHADEVMKKELPDMSVPELNAMASMLHAARLWDREQVEAVILTANWVLAGENGYRAAEEIDALLSEIEKARKSAK